MTIAERQLAPVIPASPVGSEFTATMPAAAGLRQLWAAMTTLRSAESTGTQLVLSTGLAVARDILREAVHSAGPSGARRVPSAGAIFPYETLALCRVATDPDDAVPWGLFRIEGPAATCTRLPISPGWLHHLVTTMPGGPAFEGSYLIVMTRPWLSIRKYGPRGYLYSQLDAAHAAVNIAGIALDTGAAVLHAGLPAAAATILRHGFLPCHEAHSVIELAPVRCYPGDPVVAVRDEVPARRTAQEYDFEARAWTDIVAPLQGPALHDSAETSASAEPQDTVLVTLPGQQPDHALRTQWRALSASRRSAKRFGTEPLTGAQLASTIGALATCLPSTLGQPAGGPARVAGAAVSATVLVNHRLELTAAERASITRCARLVGYPASLDPGNAIIAACMGQQHVGNGQAFVLLHAAGSLVAGNAGGRAIRRALFLAGAGAQLLCLAATRDNIAASPIGGFDSEVWTRIAQLPADTELLYLLALGSPVAEFGPARQDRAEKATAHGES